MNTATKSTSSDVRHGSDLSSQNWFFRYRIPSILAGVLVLGLLTLIYLQFSLVRGTELNARTWEVRQFTFRRDPFTNYQISGISHSAPRRMSLWSAVPQKLLSQVDPAIRKHLTRSGQIPDRWDLIRIFGNGSSSGKAWILVSLLYATDANYNDHWTTWSVDHPTQAAVLWPAAQDLVRFELYSQLPALFETTLLESDDEEFEQAVQSVVQQSLVEHCQQLVTNQEHLLARDVAAVGLTYGDLPELQKIVDSKN